MNTTEYSGTWTAIITPFTEDGQIDEKALRNIINNQIQAGVTGIVPVGTTGESPTTTMEEDSRIFQIAVEEAKGKVKIMAGTGSNCTRDAVHYTQNAKDAGVTCCLVVTPYYNKPTQEGIIQHYTQIAKVGLPIIVYNIAGRTGTNISTETLMELAKNEMIVGVKEASGNIQQIQEVLEKRPKNFTVLSGDDALTLELIKRGGNGVVSVASNIVPERIVALVNNALNGNFNKAEQQHNTLVKLFETLFIESNPIPVKYAASLLQLCLPEYRLPMCPPTKNTQEIIKEALHHYQLIT